MSSIILVVVTMCTAIFMPQPAISATQDVVLSSNLQPVNEDPIAYNNQVVIFTCVVRDSNILEWNSAEYIGQGGFPLQLLSFNGTETNVSSTTNPNTYAVRVNVTTSDGQTVIASDLRIIASTRYPVATVTCSADSTRSITFKTLSSALPASTTQDVVFNGTSTLMATTVTALATEDLADSTPKNQQSCNTGNVRVVPLAVILALSLVVNVITIAVLILILICYAKCARSGNVRVREFQATTPATSDSKSPRAQSDGQESNVSLKPSSSTEHNNTRTKQEQKKGLLGWLHGGMKQLGLDECMNLKGEVQVESAVLIDALQDLYDSLKTGPPSEFKRAIECLTDDLHVKKVSDEELQKSLVKLRQINTTSNSYSYNTL